MPWKLNAKHKKVHFKTRKECKMTQNRKTLYPWLQHQLIWTNQNITEWQCWEQEAFLEQEQCGIVLSDNRDKTFRLPSWLPILRIYIKVLRHLFMIFHNFVTLRPSPRHNMLAGLRQDWTWAVCLVSRATSDRCLVPD